MLFDDSTVTVLPFMHQFIEEYKARRASHKSQPGCPSCKSELYLDDLIAKSVSTLSSLSEDNKIKLKKFLATSEDVFLTRKENGNIKERQIA